MDKIVDVVHEAQDLLGSLTAPRVSEHEHEMQNRIAEIDKQEHLAHEHEHEHEHEHGHAVKPPPTTQQQAEATEAKGGEMFQDAQEPKPAEGTAATATTTAASEGEVGEGSK